MRGVWDEERNLTYSSVKSALDRFFLLLEAALVEIILGYSSYLVYEFKEDQLTQIYENGVDHSYEGIMSRTAMIP